MGGGLSPDGTLPPHVIARCEAVLDIKGFANRGLVVASSSFSLNCPPKHKDNRLPLSEASAISRWLRGQGYSGSVMCEQQSHDSVGSVFFVLALFASYLNISQVKFITSEFHVDRVAYIAEFINTRVFDTRFKVDTYAVNNVGFTLDRERHEATSLDKFKAMFGDILDRQDFAARFFSQHGNYNENFGSDVVLSGNLLY